MGTGTMVKLLFCDIFLVLVIRLIVADAVDLAVSEFSQKPTDVSISNRKYSDESGSSSSSGSGFGSGYGFGSGNAGHGGSSSAISGPGYGSGSGYGYGYGSNGAAGYGFGYGSGSGGGTQPATTTEGNRNLVSHKTRVRPDLKSASAHQNAGGQSKGDPFFRSVSAKANRRIPGLTKANPSISKEKRAEVRGSASHITTKSAIGSGT